MIRCTQDIVHIRKRGIDGRRDDLKRFKIVERSEGRGRNCRLRVNRAKSDIIQADVESHTGFGVRCTILLPLVKGLRQFERHVSGVYLHFALDFQH
jgi:hypothetical protein